jgi:hypothetical protein
MSKQAVLMLTLILGCSSGAAQPAVIPRLSRAPHDAHRTYEIVRNYLSNPRNGFFSIIRADPAAETIVARRTGIDTEQWGEWAYCKLGPEQMLDSLKDASVTLTVKITSAGKVSSEISVIADFRATYGLGSSETNTQCVSTGVLEDRILRAAGATPEAA